MNLEPKSKIVEKAHEIDDLIRHIAELIPEDDAYFLLRKEIY